MDIGTGLSVAKATKNTANWLMTWAKAKKDAEAISKITELLSQLMELTSALSNAQDEIRELQQKRDAHEGMIFDQNVYWLTMDGERTGPFCPKCLRHDRRAPMAEEIHDWLCPVCLHRQETPRALDARKRSLEKARNRPPPTPYT